MKLRLAACIYAALMLALAGFASTALAGSGGHGNGGGKQQHQTQGSGGSGDNSTGVKPSNSTKKDTHASASSDQTKQYGNGQTAGQIATKAGYGDATLHGPGNSQPHKVNCGGHEVDVHALKHKKCGGVEGAEHASKSKSKAKTESEHKSTTQSESDHKVTICHKTGSATNPYVEITVDYHALKNGHTAAKGDIIPAPAGGCPTAAAAVQSATKSQSETKAAASCFETKVVETTVVSVEHFIGPKGSGRFRVIHPNSHSSHFRNKHPDVITTTTVPTTVKVKAACPSTTVTESVTRIEQVTKTVAAAAVPAPPAPAAPTAAPAPAAPAPAPVAAGGVLGATAPLHTSKPKATGGVLGTTVRLGKSVGSTNLPFTGLPLWIFALVAGGLILAGAAARRAGAES